MSTVCCAPQPEVRDEIFPFPFSCERFFLPAEKKHTLFHRYHSTGSRFAGKTDCLGGLGGRRGLGDRSSGPLSAFSTPVPPASTQEPPPDSSNYLPRSLLNHADCRPHATDKFSCHDTLSFVSYFLRISPRSPFVVATPGNTHPFERCFEDT